MSGNRVRLRFRQDSRRLPLQVLKAFPVATSSDFLSVEVWSWQRLVTCWVLFVIELATRKVCIAGMTTHPDTSWMLHTQRHRDGRSRCRDTCTSFLSTHRAATWRSTYRPEALVRAADGILHPLRSPLRPLPTHPSGNMLNALVGKKRSSWARLGYIRADVKRLASYSDTQHHDDAHNDASPWAKRKFKPSTEHRFA